MAGKEVEVTVHQALLSSPGHLYAALELGRVHEQTKTVDRTATPVWEYTVRFPVKDETAERVRVIVYRKSRLFGSAEVGWCEVALDDLPQGQPLRRTKKLIVGSGNSDSDTLEISCRAFGFGRSSAALLHSAALSPLMSSLVPTIQKLGPAFQVAANVVDASAPHLNRLFALLEVAWYRYNLEALVPAFLGLAGVFLGGTYMTTIAAVEAYRLCGWDNTRRSLHLLLGELKQAQIVVSQLEDEDEDERHGLGSSRKFEAAVSAIDPVALEQGLLGLYQGTLAVLATLRTRFAHAITLGASLSDMGFRELSPVLIPLVKKATPERYHKWVPFLVKYTISTIVCSLAWTLLRIFSAFHSAIYGAHLLAQGVLAYLVKQKQITPERAAQLNVTAVIWGVGCLGFLWQLSTGFRLPFPLNLLLFPLTIVETLLMLVVNWDHSWL